MANLCDDGQKKKSCALAFSQSMKAVRECSWYWGNISWQEAERVLLDRCPGTFLVRDSASDRYIFTVSYRTANSVLHTRLPRHGGYFCLGGPNALVKAHSLVTFVEESIQKCKERGVCLLMHKKDVRSGTEMLALGKPLRRHEILPCLKYLCRVVLRHSFSLRTINSLPVPSSIKRYILSPKYLVPH